MSVQTPNDSPTFRRHRRQLAWQILVPVLLMAVLGIAAGLLVVRAGAGRDRLFADTALIWLIAPLLLAGLLFAALLGFMIYGLARLLQVTPGFTGRLQDVSARAAGVTKKAADAAASPILRVNEAVAVVRHFIARFLSDQED